MNHLPPRNPAEDLPDLSTPPPLKLNIRYPDIVTPDRLSMKHNYHNLCRLCADETPDIMPIFKGEGVKYDIAAKIRKYMNLRVLASEFLPEFICAACASTLLSFHELVRSARITDYMMRTHVGASPSMPVPAPLPSSSSGNEVIKNGVKYVDVGTDAPKMPEYRHCRTCSLHRPARRYNFHVANRLSRVVYRCEECSSYLDKDDVLFHLDTNIFEDLPDHVKEDYYNTEKAYLEEQAKVDPQAKIDLDHLNDYFRKKAEVDAVKRERGAGAPPGRTEHDRPARGAGRIDEAGPATERSADRSSDEGQSEADSDEDPLTPKREPVESSESSPVKRPKKRVSIARSGQRAKELADHDDEDGADDEVDSSPAAHSPKASRACPICGKQYRASSSYFYHMKYFHKRSREHECSVCNKKFGTKANLAQHASIHTGAYDLECKECGKRFKSKPSLYIHEQSHGGPKRWACSQCGRSFRWRTHLARHMSRHAAERAHVCATCGRGFSVRCDLLRHARTHAAAEFRCATCGLKFAQKRYLQVHMVKKHPESPAPAVTRS